MFCGRFLGRKLGIAALGLLWYVRDLFILNLLAVIIKKIVDFMPIPMLILTMTVWLAKIPIPGIGSFPPVSSFGATIW